MSKYSVYFGMIISLTSILCVGCAQGVLPNDEITFQMPSPGGVSESDGASSGTSSNPSDMMNLPTMSGGTPILMRIGDKIAYVNQELRIELVAMDPNDDPLSYQLKSPLPDNARFDKELGIFSWTPSQIQLGVEVFLTFEVNDGTNRAQETIKVRVEGEGTAENHPPNLEPIGDQVLRVGQPWTFQLVGTDLDGDTLIYEVSGAVPMNFMINSETGMLNWTPQDTGTIELIAKVRDASEVVSAPLRLVIREMGGDSSTENQPPRFVPMEMNQTVTVGDTVSFNLIAEDELPDQLVFGVMGELPEGAAFLAPQKFFEWTPREDQAGRSFPVVFFAQDADFTVYMRINFQVEFRARSCPDDPDPKDVPIEVMSPQTFQDRVLCSGEIDEYQITVMDGQTLSITADFIHADGDVDMRLFNPMSESISVSTSVTDNEEFTTPVLSAGVYLLQLNVVNGPNRYSLVIDYIQNSCQNDMFDQSQLNDTPNTATSLTTQSVDSLMICPGDEDYYAVMLNVGDTLRANISFRHLQGDLDFALLKDGALLRSAVSSNDNEEFEYGPVQESGVYVLRIYPYVQGTQGVSYGLSYEILQTISCEPDQQESNDTSVDAQNLAPNLYTQLTGCGDPDWYYTSVENGRSLVLYLTYPSEAGFPSVDVENGAGESLDIRQNVLGKVNGCIHPTLTLGDRCLRIESAGDTGNLFYNISFSTPTEYELRVRLGDELGSQCFGDYECNVQIGDGPTPICQYGFARNFSTVGTCTWACESDTDCGHTGYCIRDAASGLQRCLQRCDDGLDCRDQFLCSSSQNVDNRSVDVCVRE